MRLFLRDFSNTKNVILSNVNFLFQLLEYGFNVLQNIIEFRMFTYNRNMNNCEKAFGSGEPRLY